MPIPAGYGQVNFRIGGTSLPHGAEVTFGFRREDPDLSPLLTAGAFHLRFVNTFLTQMANTTGLVSTLVKFGPDATGPSAIHSNTVLGSANYPAASAQVTYLIRKFTEFGGRAGRGRLYLPGVVEPVVDGAGFLLPDTVTNLTAEAREFLEGSTLGDTPLVLLHQPGSPLEGPTTITDLACDQQVATQRRRLRR